MHGTGACRIRIGIIIVHKLLAISSKRYKASVENLNTFKKIQHEALLLRFLIP